MHVYLIEVTNEDGTSFIHQVMNSPRGAFESMREYASSINADVDDTVGTRWNLIDRETGDVVGVVDSIRKPVMSFDNGR